MPFIIQGKSNIVYILIVVILAAIVGGGIWWWKDSLTKMEETTPIKEIKSFEECVAAGYLILELYPRQCKTPGGKTFVEEIQLEDETADWKTYRNEEMGFEIKYPPEDWSVMSESDTYVLIGKAPYQLPGFPFAVKISNQTLDDYISDYKSMAMCRLGPPPETESIKKVGEFTLGGISATKLEACSDFFGTNIDIIFARKNNKSYIIQPISGNTIHDQMLSTFKFIERGVSCGGWDTFGDVVCECSGKIGKYVCPQNTLCDSGLDTCYGTCGECKCYQGPSKDGIEISCNGRDNYFK